MSHENITDENPIFTGYSASNSVVHEEIHQNNIEENQFEKTPSSSTEEVSGQPFFPENNEFHTTIMKHLLEGILILDFKGRVLYANDTLVKMLGANSYEEFIGTNALKFIDVNFHKQVIKDQLLVRMGKGGFLNSYKVHTMDDRIIWVEGLGNKIKYHGKSVNLVFLRDITERKKAEEALARAHDELEHQVNQRTDELTQANKQLQREISERKTIEKILRLEEEKLRTVLNSIHEGITLSDKEGNFLIYNSEMERLTGFSQEDARGTNNFHHLIHREDADREKALEVLQSLTTPGDLYETETVITTKKGTQKNILVSTVFIQYKQKDMFLTTYHDISERKTAEDKIHAQQEKLKSIFESSPNSITVSDLEGNIIDCNQATLDLFESTKEQFVGQSIFKHIYQQEIEKAEIMINRLYKGETIKNEEIIFVTSHGRSFHAEVSVSLLRNTDGKPMGMVGITRDITNKKEAEKHIQFRLSFEKIISTLSSRFVGVINTDEAINEALADMGVFCGASRSYLFLFDLLKSTMSNTHEWCAKNVSSEKDSLQEIPIDTFPWWIQRLKQNEIIHVNDIDELPEEAQAEKDILQRQKIKSVLVVPLFLQGRLHGFIGFDNVEKTRSWTDEDTKLLTIVSEIFENALDRESIEEKLWIKDNAIASSINAMAIIDLGGQITYVNTSFLSFWGYESADDVIGQPIVKFWKMKGETVEIMDALLKGDSWSGELIAERKDRSTFIARLSASAVLNDNKKPICMLASFIDVTDQKKAEEEIQKSRERIQRQNEKLKKLDQLKSSFLNVTSHELRTPMSAIKGYIQMVLKQSLGDITDEQKNALNIVLRNTNRLDHLIQDILDISRLESGTMKFILEEVTVSKLVNDIADTMQSIADTKKITLKTKIYKQLPKITIDGERITQVLINLINNAIKFSPERSEIFIKVSKKGEDIEFQVRDFGRGIPKEKQNKVFDTFYQVDSGMDRKFGGAGLGLAISRGIILAHGGSLQVQSQGIEGKGSLFSFKLPIQSSDSCEERFKEVDVFGFESEHGETKP